MAGVAEQLSPEHSGRARCVSGGVALRAIAASAPSVGRRQPSDRRFDRRADAGRVDDLDAIEHRHRLARGTCNRLVSDKGHAALGQFRFHRLGNGCENVEVAFFTLNNDRRPAVALVVQVGPFLENAPSRSSKQLAIAYPSTSRCTVLRAPAIAGHTAEPDSTAIATQTAALGPKTCNISAQLPELATPLSVIGAPPLLAGSGRFAVGRQ